jgi:outer membrane receptor protein involved in Fe transport
MRRLLLHLVLAALVVPQPASAQVAGKGRVQGTVVDTKSGESLPGANVTIKGTYYGASSNVEGTVRIENVNPGNYTLEVSLIGYKTVQFTSFRVTEGQTATFRAPMEETVLSLDKEIVVVGQRPLFDIEETASRKSVEQADIQAAAIQSVQGIVAQQAGVVAADNEIHIRGGRTYENAYLIDGVSVQDVLAGSGFGLQLSPASIQEMEVFTGGYNAEYGQATSGIVNITTREGADRFSGSVSYRTDHFGLNSESRGNWNTNIVDFTLGGPLIPDHLSFFLTMYGNTTDEYTRWVEVLGSGNRPVGYEVQTPHGLYSSIAGGRSLAPRRSNNYSAFAKLTFKPIATFKVSYSFSQSLIIDQNTQSVQVTLERVEPNPGYQYEFQYIPDSANTFTQRNIQHALSITHTLSPQTFYEVRFSHYQAHVRGDANGKSFEYYIEPQDIVTYPINYYNLGRDTVGVVPGDGFYDLGSPSKWRDHMMIENTLKFDLTHFFAEKHKFKTGVEMRFQQMQMAEVVQPWFRPLGYDNDIYSVAPDEGTLIKGGPAQGSVYVQDNITVSGMILNAGLRLDYWVPGSYVDDVCRDTSSALVISRALREQYLEDTFSLFGARAKARLSPRLGISHPVSDNQTLFFSYGHFSKIPRPQYVYSKLDRTSVRSDLPVGNPNLNPETTVAYELGIRNQFTGDDVLSVTAFYKDIFDYIAVKTVRRLNSQGAAQYYTTYINTDYARSRGVEVEYKKRVGNWFRGSAFLSYSIVTGKSSTPNENQIRLQQGQPENIKETYLNWDRPVQASLNMNFTVVKGAPLFGFGEGVLDDYNLFVRIFGQSGKRYTPLLQTGTDPLSGRSILISNYNRQLESISVPWFYINLNFEKFIDVGLGQLTLGIEVQNLLDRKNPQIVNPATGRAYEYGDPTPSSYNDPLYPQVAGDISPFPYDPARYLNPRTIRLSLAFRF